MFDNKTLRFYFLFVIFLPFLKKNSSFCLQNFHAYLFSQARILNKELKSIKKPPPQKSDFECEIQT